MGKTKRQDVASEKNDTIQKLKGIVREQMKTISRLEKELKKREDVSEDYSETLNELAGAVEVRNNPVMVKNNNGCPECGKEVTISEIGKFFLERCTDCNYRKRR